MPQAGQHAQRGRGAAGAHLSQLIHAGGGGVEPQHLQRRVARLRQEVDPVLPILPRQVPACVDGGERACAGSSGLAPPTDGLQRHGTSGQRRRTPVTMRCGTSMAVMIWFKICSHKAARKARGQLCLELGALRCRAASAAHLWHRCCHSRISTGMRCPVAAGTARG